MTDANAELQTAFAEQRQDAINPLAKRYDRICDVCGEGFNLRARSGAKLNGKRRFCSRQCSAVHQRRAAIKNALSDFTINEAGCWIRGKAKNSRYGKTSRGSAMKLTHRLFYEHFRPYVSNAPRVR